MQEWIAKVWPSIFIGKGLSLHAASLYVVLETLPRAKKWKRLGRVIRNQNLFRGKSKVQPIIFILQRKINNFPQLFLHEEVFPYFWRKICEQILFNFFAEKVARGNSVQIAPNFPAKSLSIYTSGFFQTPF